MGRHKLGKYERVQLSTEVNLAFNGRRVRRYHTAYQLLSPDNRNAKGEPKTRGEILAELAKTLQEWREKKTEEFNRAATQGSSVLGQGAVLSR